MLPELAAISALPPEWLTFKDNGPSVGSVQPRTLSDLSPLKVKGSHRSQLLFSSQADQTGGQ